MLTTSLILLLRTRRKCKIEFSMAVVERFHFSHHIITSCNKLCGRTKSQYQKVCESLSVYVCIFEMLSAAELMHITTHI